MSSITIKTGREGPREDPYHYVEITVHRRSTDFTGTVTCHQGLAEWVRVHEPGKQQQVFEDTDQGEWFELYAGVSVKTAERAFREMKARKIRYHPCGERYLDWVNGYPGEELLHCGKCGTVLDATFDLSAVE